MTNLCCGPDERRVEMCSLDRSNGVGTMNSSRPLLVVGMAK